MSTIDKRPLKAFVRFDGTGRVVPSSLILRRKKPKVGKWVEIPAYECCNPVYTTTTTAALPLRMLFSNIIEVDAIVGDSSNVADWNTYFDLPTYGAPFTSVSVSGNEVKLYGGSSIIIKQELFDQPDELGTYLLEVDDAAGCVIELEYDAFGQDYNSGCPNLASVNLPALTVAGDYAFYYCGDATIATIFSLPSLVSAGEYCFGDIALTSISLPSAISLGQSCFSWCTSLTSVDIPLVTSVGDSCFIVCTSITSIPLLSCTDLGGTVGNNFVFNSIIGNTITLTVPSALMTADAGNPDGDIVYLQANNTVTIVTV